MQTIEHTLTWRRLDLPGLDAAYFGPTSNGWRLCGTAIFAGEAGPCHLGYAVDADPRWRTRSAHVFGTVGSVLVDIHVAASAERLWTLNGGSRPEAAGCLDIDLGFTTAPRLFTLRRLALADGQEGVAPVARLRLDETDLDTGLEAVTETYLRLHRHAVRFTSSAGGLPMVLGVDAHLAVTRFPARWDSDAFAAVEPRVAPPAAATRPDYHGAAPANAEALRAGDARLVQR